MDAGLAGHGRDTPMFSFDGKQFNARVVAAHDADTVRVVYDTEHEGYKQLILRLYGIDAPEIRSSNKDEKAAAVRARDALLNMMLPGKFPEGYAEKQVTAVLDKHVALVKVVCRACDKYGRVLAELYDAQGSSKESFNDKLIKAGHAKAYFGKTKQAWGV